MLFCQILSSSTTILNFIGDNIFLFAGLLVGIVAGIVMRKTFKIKP